MGYDILIGERIEVKTASVENDPCLTVSEYRVNGTEHSNAPTFFDGDISKNTNGRYPGYSSFSDWCCEVGLNDLFFDDEHGLMREHPGIVTLKENHLAQITRARQRWEMTHEDCKSKIPLKEKQPLGYKGRDISKRSKIDENYDWSYAKLLWYEFWGDWALKNCTRPAIYNS